MIVGPGPGDPRDDDDPKMRTLRAVVDRLLAREQPFLAVCLGHQALCHAARASRSPTRTSSSRAPSRRCQHRRAHRAGRLLQHLRRPGPAARCPTGVEVEADPETGDIHLVRGPHFRGIQFHAESILTEHGYDLIHDLVRDVVP